jgi:hypothetical protein
MQLTIFVSFSFLILFFVLSSSILNKLKVKTKNKIRNIFIQIDFGWINHYYDEVDLRDLADHY